MSGDRSSIGLAGLAVAMVLSALTACRETRATDPPVPPSSTVIARKPDRAPAGTKEEEHSVESARVRARAMALARFASGDEPVYPEMSRRLQEEGTVELKIGLLQDGSVQELQVARSSGHRRLDDAALAAARTWRFNPRTGGGEVEVIPYRVVFQLVDEKGDPR